MANKLRYLIVWGLERACAVTHVLRYVPVVRNYTRCWLANWSGDLEERWETGAWRRFEEADDDD